MKKKSDACTGFLKSAGITAGSLEGDLEMPHLYRSAKDLDHWYVYGNSQGWMDSRLK